MAPASRLDAVTGKAPSPHGVLLRAQRRDHAGVDGRLTFGTGFDFCRAC